jgi:hypothetical protein
VPIDNYITRGTETFLSNPTYLKQARTGPCHPARRVAGWQAAHAIPGVKRGRRRSVGHGCCAEVFLSLGVGAAL